MRRLFAMSVAIALAAGCRDREADQLAKIRDAVCKCSSASCGEAAMKAIPQDEHERSRRTQQVAREMLDCMAKLYDAGRPSTDPDAATGSDSATP